MKQNNVVKMVLMEECTSAQSGRAGLRSFFSFTYLVWVRCEFDRRSKLNLSHSSSLMPIDEGPNIFEPSIDCHLRYFCNGRERSPVIDDSNDLAVPTPVEFQFGAQIVGIPFLVVVRLDFKEKPFIGLVYGDHDLFWFLV